MLTGMDYCDRRMRDKYSRVYRARLIEAGIDPMVKDVTVVRDHVTWLHGIGMSHRVIGAAAGVSGTFVRDLEAGRRTMVRFGSAQAILAATHVPPVVSDLSLVPKIGAVRRLRALGCLGWSHPMLAEATGIPARQIVSKGACGLSCSYRHWLLIADAYERESMTVRDSVRSRLKAQRSGWAPPLEWDVVDIDDPRSCPESWNVSQHASELLTVGFDVGLVAACTGMTVPRVKACVTGLRLEQRAG